jgi:hypothetical protein
MKISCFSLFVYQGCSINPAPLFVQRILISSGASQQSRAKQKAAGTVPAAFL